MCEKMVAGMCVYTVFIIFRLMRFLQKMLKTCQCNNFLCKVIAQFDEVSKLLRPVMLNMAITLIAWIYVYEMRTDDRLSAMFLMSGNNTTGNKYKDGIINAFTAMIILAIVSFTMLLLALWDCRRLVQLWLHMSCILILFGVSGGFFYDLLKSLEMNEEKIFYEYLPALVTAYGGFGCIAFFYHAAPLLLHQFYVLSNCSLVSLFYLRSFPGYTTWFLLWCVALWDIFAVLAPIGPLRKVQEKAGDYNHDVLRFLMFTADVGKIPDVADKKQITDKKELKNETEAESSSQQAEATTDTLSFTSMSDNSEDDVVPQLEQPQLRRRVRQTAGSDFVIEDILKEEDHIEMDEKREDGRVRKDKESDLSSEDEITVKMETDTDGDTSKYNYEKYPIDDEEALNNLDNDKKILESSSSSSSYSSSDSSDLSTTEEETKNIEGKSITAADALNDASTLRLGMGDFVFYSVLVGQAATTGSIGATIAAALGVVYGLLITLTYFSNSDETTPALPISIVLGTLFHYSYLFLEPTVMFYSDFLFHYVLYALAH